MKTLTFLFEFYESVHDEWHAKFEEYAAQTMPQAESQFFADYPEGRIINRYVAARDVEVSA